MGPPTDACSGRRWTLCVALLAPGLAWANEAASRAAVPPTRHEPSFSPTGHCIHGGTNQGLCVPTPPWGQWASLIQGTSERYRAPFEPRELHQITASSTTASSAASAAAVAASRAAPPAPPEGSRCGPGRAAELLAIWGTVRRGLRAAREQLREHAKFHGEWMSSSLLLLLLVVPLVAAVMAVLAMGMGPPGLPRHIASAPQDVGGSCAVTTQASLPVVSQQALTGSLRKPIPLLSQRAMTAGRDGVPHAAAADVRSSTDAYLAIAQLGTPSPSLRSPYPTVRNSPPASGLPGSSSLLAAQHLCPSLLVPKGCECTLQVPQLRRQHPSGGEHMINDPTGNPVMRVFLGLASGRGRRRLVLSGLEGGGILAACQEEVEADPVGGARTLLSIHDATSLFGQLHPLVPASRGYEAVSAAGRRVYVCPSSFSGGGGWAITDDRGQLLAVAEPPAPDHRTVRIDSFVDAGLVVICILGTDLLESTA